MAKTTYQSKPTQPTEPVEQTEQTQTDTTSETGTESQVEGTQQTDATTEDKPAETGTDTEQPADTDAGSQTNTETAAAVQDPVAPPATEQAPVAPEVTEQAPVAPVVEETQLTAEAEAQFSGEVEQARLLRQELMAYIGDMATNRRIDPITGAGHQVALSRLIDGTVTEKDPKTFIALMSVWNQVIAEHRSTVFNERYVNRFAEHVSLSKQKLKSYQYLVNLFLTIADRTPVSEVLDLDTTLKGIPDEFASRLRQYALRVTAKRG